MGMEQLTSKMNQRRAEVLQGHHRCLEREGLAPSSEDLQVTLRGRALFLVTHTAVAAGLQEGRNSETPDLLPWATSAKVQQTHLAAHHRPMQAGRQRDERSARATRHPEKATDGSPHAQKQQQTGYGAGMVQREAGEGGGNVFPPQRHQRRRNHFHSMADQDGKNHLPSPDLHGRDSAGSTERHDGLTYSLLLLAST